MNTLGDITNTSLYFNGKFPYDKTSLLRDECDRETIWKLEMDLKAKTFRTARTRYYLVQCPLYKDMYK